MTDSTTNILRSPVIAVMGHVDHGKSALLDYIRSTNVVELEAGGITQHVSAYEVEHEHEGVIKKITFLDTPGHEAFAKIRARGASVADIAILVVSAEEGVKPQTLDALRAIQKTGIPYVVAINKIDKPNANPNTTKASLIENEIYIEGMGGDIPFNEVSAKTGEGVSELLDTLLLVAELEELTGDTAIPAEGVVIEAHRDPKKGVAATLIIKNGSLRSGEYIVADNSLAPVRIFENFEGKSIKEASFSSPVRIIGFDSLPSVGSTFRAYQRKKDAELAKGTASSNRPVMTALHEEDERHLIPLIIKADATGTLEAIEHELLKLGNERIVINTILDGVGNVSESDIQTALASTHDVLVVAFNVGIDASARDIAMQNEKEIHSFNIIYKLSEWLDEVIKSRIPKMEMEEQIGAAKILMYFSSMKNKYVVGGKVKEGQVVKNRKVRIKRANELIGSGVIKELQSGKQSVDTINEGDEFGAQIEADIALEAGDIIECLEMVVK
ncbi:MAG: translation initiation factor IF-2 [Parcubacteria group bacterium]|nr:translation initiation factor IF-2 [Parcubacteria group bacterium]|tara:strand:+ start:362 stop:1858 length:1497 start_codon:yes stop_codon:yes gene_type:complete